MKLYSDNTEFQKSNETLKLKQRVSSIVEKQKISLFEEEDEMPDSSLVTAKLMHELTCISAELVSELLHKSDTIKQEAQSVDIGITLDELKKMQQVARQERQ